MSGIAIASDLGRVVPVLDRAALGAVLLTPLLLLHAHGIAEVAIAVADLCFLARSAISRDWSWARTPWLLIGWAWWGWLLVCSLPVPALDLGEGHARSLVQAVVLVRFLILLAAMEHAILRTPDARRWLYWIIAAATAYIAIHVVFQFASGFNLYGEPAGGDGEMTGPFGKPRAGPPFVRILLPALIPWAAAMLGRPGVRPVIQAWLVLIGGAAVALLIGQRMPLLLICLGLIVIGVLLPRLRWGVMAAGVAIAALLVASPVVAPRAHYRLVEKFSNQMEHFATSHYGELYTRAAEIALQNPVTGLGAEGFRTGCPNPRYFRATFDGSIADGGGAPICWNHPHNYYLEALVNGGFPGLILFAALGVAWLAALGRGLWRQPDPLRVALLAAAVIQLWPIASSTGFTSMPVGGWSFLLLGWGLAEARWPNRQHDPI
jgi:O-antigen ligase